MPEAAPYLAAGVALPEGQYLRGSQASALVAKNIYSLSFRAKRRICFCTFEDRTLNNLQRHLPLRHRKFAIEKFVVFRIELHVTRVRNFAHVLNIRRFRNRDHTRLG